MTKTQLLEAVKTYMPEKRYIHTLGVMNTAVALAKKYGEDMEKAQTAAILHDIAKYADVAWMEDIVRQQKLDEGLIGWGSELLHGPVGAYMAENDFDITDEEILDAIRYHTTGRPNMTRLDKIIFVADMIEPNRKFPGVERLRKKAQKNLDKAMSACIRHSLTFLIDSKQPIYPLSLLCYNDIIRKEEN